MVILTFIYYLCPLFLNDHFNESVINSFFYFLEDKINIKMNNNNNNNKLKDDNNSQDENEESVNEDSDESRDDLNVCLDF